LVVVVPVAPVMVVAAVPVKLTTCHLVQFQLQLTPLLLV
tara:strand:+ start:8 stop:124 length:117 start_codon:yes stop_codon:yes gene_type:complete